MSFEVDTLYIPGDRIKGIPWKMEELNLLPVHNDCTVCRKGIFEGRVVEGVMLGEVKKNKGCVIIKFYGDCNLDNVSTKTGNTCKVLYVPKNNNRI